MLARINKYIMNKKWKKKNAHNQTYIGNIFDFNKVSVGRATYGELNVGNDTNSKVVIGNYVSIGANVIFLAGLEHPTNLISTYPFKVKSCGLNLVEAKSKGNIIVNDDVWIASNVLVMSGVTIGQGAVIAAGAVVTKNVPPYAIVAGVPAKVIKYRFSKDIIDELLKVDYSKLSDDMIKKHVDELYMVLSDVKQLEWLPKKQNGT